MILLITCTFFYHTGVNYSANIFSMPSYTKWCKVDWFICFTSSSEIYLSTI